MEDDQGQPSKLKTGRKYIKKKRSSVEEEK